jgi:hypothetical protein
MFDNKFWEEIREKNPEAYKKFLGFHNIKEYVTGRNPEKDFLWWDKIKKITIFFEDISYDAIERFFDNNEIIILPKYLVYVEKNKIATWYFEICNNDGTIIFISNNNIQAGMSYIKGENVIKTRDEVKLQAIPKAFEIMENRLKEKKE